MFLVLNEMTKRQMTHSQMKEVNRNARLPQEPHWGNWLPDLTHVFIHIYYTYPKNTPYIIESS